MEVNKEVKSQKRRTTTPLLSTLQETQIDWLTSNEENLYVDNFLMGNSADFLPIFMSPLLNKKAHTFLSTCWVHFELLRSVSMFQREQFEFDDQGWFRQTNFTKLQIGGRKEFKPRSFLGSVSCVQLFNRGLNQAEIDFKRYCPDVDQQTHVKVPCPDKYELIEGLCLKVTTFFCSTPSLRRTPL